MDFAQIYGIGVDWHAYGTLFIWHDGRKIAKAMKDGNPKQQERAI